MDSARENDPMTVGEKLEAIDRDLEAVSAAIVQAKLMVATGGVPDLQTLLPPLARSRDAIAQMPANSAKSIEPRLMALLDDTATLERGLRQSLANLDSQRQARDTHLQAATAYRLPHGR